MNAFVRAYIVDPSLSTNGSPIGGLKGFLKILQKLVRETRPDQIVICWDGPGGSQKRKQKNKNYKSGRKPIRLNRNVKVLTDDEMMINKIWQQTRLMEYLNEMPVSQIMLEGVEADDVIAYVAQMPSLVGWQKIIVSSDKDFYQLCDDETVLYRPIQKKVLNSKRIIEEIGIHPRNMALARAIAGDKSDNLPGVGGVGLATLAKRIPLLSQQDFSIDELCEFCYNALEEKELKAFRKIVKNVEVISHNYAMMQLYAPSLSPVSKQKVRYAVEEAEQLFNKTELQKMMITDGFGVWNWTSLEQNLKRIVQENK